MLTRKEGTIEVKVIDFGLAKAANAAGEMELTHNGFVGTPAFASPEQFAHGAIDARTDIYALGVTMWFALTGRLPFAGTTIEEIRERQTDGALPNEQLKSRDVPRPLIELLHFCLAVNPAERPASARELMGALEACRAHLSSRHRKQKLAMALLACTIVTAAVFVLARNKPSSPVTRPVEANIPAKPTENAEAYLLYLRSLEAGGENEYRNAVALDQQAIDLDPSFALARARLSIWATELANAANEPEWNAKARAEAEEALRLQPNLGDAWLAMAYVYLNGDGDPERAAVEAARAGELEPNSAEVPLLTAFICKRQYKFRERIAALQRAEALDPRNARVRAFQFGTYQCVRDWPAAMRSLDRRGVFRPNEQAILLWFRGNDEFRRTSDINALKEAIAGAERIAPDASWLNAARYEVAILARDYQAAAKFLEVVSQEDLDEATQSGAHLKVFHELLLAVASGDPAAPAALERVERELEARLSQKVERNYEAHLRADRALVLTFLGRKEDAIREALHAVELVPVPGASIEKNFLSSAVAMVYAQNNEPEKAIPLIEHLLTVPCEISNGAIYNMTLADLTWRWQWDPLRSHPRFQKLVAGPEPVTIY
jgi:tetratricopeptide (TPR) repeat protein